MTAPRKDGSGRNGKAFPVRRFLVVLATWMVLWWMPPGLALAPVLPGEWLTVFAMALAAAAPVAVIGRGLSMGSYPSATLRLLVMRPFWYAQLLLPLMGLSAALGGVAGLPFGTPGEAARWTMGVVAALALPLAIIGYMGSQAVRVRHLDAFVAALPPALDGLRIVQLSDLHVGPHTSARHLARVARAAEGAEAHLIAITGDQVDDFARDVEYFARAFSGLRAPLGVFTVAGNHDVYAGWAGVRDGMLRAGFRVLVNEAVPVRHGGAELWVAGTGDPAGRQVAVDGGTPVAPDVSRTMQHVPAGAVSLVLAHNPALWPALAQRGATLTLSGHTHHGQLSIPRLGWCLASPFLDLAMGSHRAGESLLYIHPGTNYWGIPFRIGALPEVAVITLRAGNGSSGIAPARV